MDPIPPTTRERTSHIVIVSYFVKVTIMAHELNKISGILIAVESEFECFCYLFICARNNIVRLNEFFDSFCVMLVKMKSKKIMKKLQIYNNS